MVFQCNGCESKFHEKKNLQQHMRIRHGFKEYKCRSHGLRHKKTIHGNELFKCEQCEYSNTRKDILYQYIRNKHLDKSIKYEECDDITD